MFITTGPSPNLPQKRTYLARKSDTLERATPLDKSSQQELTELTHQALYLNAVQWATVFSSSAQLQSTAQQCFTSPALPGLLQRHDTRNRECYQQWTYLGEKKPPKHPLHICSIQSMAQALNSYHCTIVFCLSVSIKQYATKDSVLK